MQDETRQNDLDFGDAAAGGGIVDQWRTMGSLMEPALGARLVGMVLVMVVVAVCAQVLVQCRKRDGARDGRLGHQRDESGTSLLQRVADEAILVQREFTAPFLRNDGEDFLVRLAQLVLLGDY